MSFKGGFPSREDRKKSLRGRERARTTTFELNLTMLLLGEIVRGEMRHRIRPSSTRQPLKEGGRWEKDYEKHENTNRSSRKSGLEINCYQSYMTMTGIFNEVKTKGQYDEKLRVS